MQQSYSPIALTSVLMKDFEKIINNRLDYYSMLTYLSFSLLLRSLAVQKMFA